MSQSSDSGGFWSSEWKLKDGQWSREQVWNEGQSRRLRITDEARFDNETLFGADERPTFGLGSRLDESRFGEEQVFDRAERDELVDSIPLDDSREWIGPRSDDAGREWVGSRSDEPTGFGSVAHDAGRLFGEEQGRFSSPSDGSDGADSPLGAQEQLVREELEVQEKLDRLLGREPEGTERAALADEPSFTEADWPEGSNGVLGVDPYDVPAENPWTGVDLQSEDLDVDLPEIVESIRQNDIVERQNLASMFGTGASGSFADFDAGDMGISTSGATGGLSGMNAEVSPLDRLHDIADAGEGHQAGDEGIDYA